MTTYVIIVLRHMCIEDNYCNLLLKEGCSQMRPRYCTNRTLLRGYHSIYYINLIKNVKAVLDASNLVKHGLDVCQQKNKCHGS